MALSRSLFPLFLATYFTVTLCHWRSLSQTLVSRLPRSLVVLSCSVRRSRHPSARHVRAQPGGRLVSNTYS